ncbi:MAG: carboxypeptidase regulatory-like domain-containing protein [Acidobacteriota bacterium]
MVSASRHLRRTAAQEPLRLRRRIVSGVRRGLSARSAVLTLATLCAAAAMSVSAHAVPISGRVLDVGGEPVAEGAVELRRLGEGPFEPALAEAALRDGRFTVAAPEPGLWRVRVLVPGAVPMEMRLRPLLGPRVLRPLTITPASQRTVRVTAADGSAQAGAAVRAVPASPAGRWGGQPRWRPAVRSTRTDEFGLATLAVGARETLDLSALGPGGRWTSGPGVTAAEPPTDESGQAPHAPPPEVSVLWSAQLPELGAQRWTLVRPDPSLPRADAFFSVEPGMWRLGPSDEAGRLPAAAALEPVSGVVRLGDGRRQRVELEDRQLVLRPQRAVDVRLADAEDGRAIAGAWVLAARLRPLLARSDAAGAFEIFLPPAGADNPASSERVEIVAPGYLPLSVDLGDEPPQGSGEAGDLRTFSLRPAASVSGRVVNASGLGLADVEIAVAAGRRRQQIWSDASGRFHLPTLVPGEDVHLGLSRDDLRRLETTLEPLADFEQRRGVQLVLDAAPLLVGRVVTEDGESLPGALVTLDGSVLRRGTPAVVGDDDEGVELETVADGRFAARLTVDGLLDVLVSRTGFARLRLEGLAVHGDDGRFDLGDLVLESSAPFAGRVVTGVEPETPVADAEIYVYPPDFERFDNLDRYLRFREPAARSDADGRFSVDGLHRGAVVSLIVEREGFGRRHAPSLEAPRDDVVIRLDRAATLSGRVITPEGEPVPRAEIFLRRPFSIDAASRRKVQAREDGTFSIADVVLGEVEVWVRGVQRPTQRQVLTVTGDRDDLELVVEGGFTVAGTVVDRDGVPLPSAAVRARRPSEVVAARFGLDRSPVSVTRGNGRFELKGLAEGAWNLEVNQGWLQVEEAIDVTSDLELTLVLDAPGEPIEGVVVDPSGAGVPGVRLKLRGPAGEASASSEVGGAFRFERVAAGTYGLQTAFSPRRVGVPVALAEDPGPVTVDGDPETPEPALQVVVREGALLRGRVLGVDTVDLPRVQVTAHGERAIYTRSRIRVDADGAYEIDRLAIGRWRVVASIPGTGRRAVGEVSFEADPPTATLDLDFASGLTLAGQVRAGDNPVPGVVLVVVDAFGLVTRLRTGADGRYAVGGLPAGPAVVTVEVDGPAAERRVELGGPARLDIDLLDD